MSIEDHLPSRENPTPAQSQGDATVKSQDKNGAVEARETDTDAPNKEIAKPETPVVDKDGAPIPNPSKPPYTQSANSSEGRMDDTNSDGDSPTSTPTSIIQEADPAAAPIDPKETGSRGKPPGQSEAGVQKPGPGGTLPGNTSKEEYDNPDGSLDAFD